MNIHRSPQSWKWPFDSLPLQTLARDWDGEPIGSTLAYGLAADPDHLWLVAQHDRPACLDPTAAAGCFHEGLWNHDVAELFLTDSRGEGYLEFNLAPNGAWWACPFASRRVRSTNAGSPPSGILTHAQSDDHGWRAAIGIPIRFLESHLDWGSGARGNVTFILGQTTQRFFSVTDLGPGAPDFHQPEKFQQLRDAFLDATPCDPPF